MEKFFINILCIGAHLRSIKMKYSTSQFKPFHFLMKLAVVSHTQMLNLFYFDKVKEDELLVHSEDIS